MTERVLELEDFADKVNDEFVISEDGIPAIVFKLVEVERLPLQNMRAGSKPPFSLIFTAQAQQLLPQRLYRLANERLGTNHIFLVPVTPDARGYLYQAVFN